MGFEKQNPYSLQQYPEKPPPTSAKPCRIICGIWLLPIVLVLDLLFIVLSFGYNLYECIEKKNGNPMTQAWLQRLTILDVREKANCCTMFQRAAYIVWVGIFAGIFDLLTFVLTLGLISIPIYQKRYVPLTVRWARKKCSWYRIPFVIHKEAY